ncbi:putative phage abortive infection protein [Vibrio sp. YMD68]|uniref:putative phage abortive infection protein n=1 Tax=Vibrio sp. YMD68 TaxID=3042300 RepID=UPI00249A0CFD|nr:putative phage abortive infection protein [Vibrio sp. YMD68]WGV98870.1 putative phage abortive infection protein [Vibrio sp. YMD68]
MSSISKIKGWFSPALDSENVKADVDKSIRFASGFISLVVCSYLAWFWGFNKQALSTDSSVWGAFGDFVGGILNPVIAYLAFYWLTRSVIIQKKELSETQKVLAETEKATKEQAKTLERQRFESSFYSLLEQMNLVSVELKSIEQNDTKKRSKLKRLYNTVIKASQLKSHDSPSSQQVPNCHEAMMINSVECNHYFRIIYHLLKYIVMNFDAENKPKDFDEAIERRLTAEEKFYSNIVRSFLDKETTQLLAFNCISNSADEFYKYRLLVERYALLEHFHIEQDWMVSLQGYYKRKAFGKHYLLGELSKANNE